MPGGIGPIDEQLSKRCRSGKPLRDIPSGAAEAEIFYNLDSGRAHFDAGRGMLYFTTSPYNSVEEILVEVFTGHDLPSIEPVMLDRHGMFNHGRRMPLDERWANTVMVALRLADIRVSVSRSG